MKRDQWIKLLRPNLAYTAKEIALLMNVNIITARQHIHRAVAYGVLEERRRGRVKFYALTDQCLKGSESAGAIEKTSTRQKPA